jgi:UDP-N-acetyl-2-amino-2-deoxyglucuronate dehydrogenase
MEKLRTGIVGCGKVGELLANALNKIESSDFLAVCDNDEKRARTFAEKYGTKAYTDTGDMVTSEKLDVVVIGTPHPVHKVPALAALQAGAHVLVEKPLASSLEDCDAMINMAAKCNKQLGMISQRRFYAPCLRIREAIDQGKIGKPVFGTVNMLGWRGEEYYQSDPWRGTWDAEGGGVLVNQVPHQLDLLQWYMGEIDELYGNWSNLNHPYISVEDTALAIVKFKNGGVGNIIASNSQKPGIYCKVHIHGSNGASIGVQTDGGAMFVAGMSGMLEPPVLDLWSVPGEEEKLKEWIAEDSDFFNGMEDPMKYFHQEQINDFLEAIIDDRAPLVTGKEGRVTVEMFTAIYRSTRDNKPVKWPLSPENRNDYDGRLKA